MPVSTLSGDGHLQQPTICEYKRRHPIISDNKAARYWQTNLRLLAGILIVWAGISYGCGILLVEPLNIIRFGGYKLGFWFAQQGSIYCFVALIFLYAWRLNRLDRDFDVDED